MRIAIAVLAAFTSALQIAHAFGTINTLGQNAEHEKITRAALPALQPKTLAELAGKKGSFGAVGAPDRPGRGLIDQSSPHCDGGDYLAIDGYPQSREAAQAKLAACRGWIWEHLDKAVAAAAPLASPSAANTALGCPFDGRSGSAKCLVLDHFGVALHAAQDFYSHTNWADKAAPGAASAKNPPGLGMTGRAAWLDPRQNGNFPAGLISGCYGFPERLSCRYSGKVRVKHDVLNKDTGPIDATGATGPGTTERGRINGNFERAVAAAIDDAKDRWTHLETRLVETYGASNAARIICVLKSDDPGPCGR